MSVSPLAWFAVQPEFGPRILGPKIPFHRALARIRRVVVRLAHMYAELTPVRNRCNVVAAIPFSSRAAHFVACFATRGNSADGIVLLLCNHARRDRLVEDQSTPCSKALLSGGVAVAMNEIFRRSAVIAAMRIAVPGVEKQKPFGVSGRAEGKQQAGSDKCFHGKYILNGKT
jgi:hypothetical protein